MQLSNTLISPFEFTGRSWVEVWKNKFPSCFWRDCHLTKFPRAPSWIWWEKYGAGLRREEREKEDMAFFSCRIQGVHRVPWVYAHGWTGGHSPTFWSRGDAPCHYFLGVENCYHRVSSFKAESHPIRFRLRLRPASRWGILPCTPNSQLHLRGHTYKGRERMERGRERN